MTQEKQEKAYTGEYKQQVIEYMQKNELSYDQTEVLFDLPKNLSEAWDRIYFDEGIEGLYKER